MASHLEDMAAELAITLRLVCEEITEFDTPEMIVKSFIKKVLVK